jgi:hypothetical protein
MKGDIFFVSDRSREEVEHWEKDFRRLKAKQFCVVPHKTAGDFRRLY